MFPDATDHWLQLPLKIKQTVYGKPCRSTEFSGVPAYKSVLIAPFLDFIGHIPFFQLVIFYHIQLKWEGFSRCPLVSAAAVMADLDAIGAETGKLLREAKKLLWDTRNRSGEDSEQKIKKRRDSRVKQTRKTSALRSGACAGQSGPGTAQNGPKTGPTMVQKRPTISYADEIILHRKNKVICAACQPILVGTPDNTRRTIS